MVPTEIRTTSRQQSFVNEVQRLGLNFIPGHCFKKGRRLGVGSFSMVYSADYIDSEKHVKQVVALKEMKNNIRDFKTQKNILLAEATLLAKIHHTYLLQYIGCGIFYEKIPTLFMVQELLEGGSLDTYLQLRRRGNTGNDPRKAYSLRSALRWSLQVTSAVAYLHSEDIKIIHRDIKLANLLLTARNVEMADAKLSDLGLAVDTTKLKCCPSFISSDWSKKSVNDIMIDKKDIRRRSCWSLWNPFNGTKRDLGLKQNPVLGESLQKMSDCYDLSQGIGSYMYMSPEVYFGVPYNEKADIYSLGVLLAELLTGTPLSCCLLFERNYEQAKNFAFCVSRGLRIKCHKSFPKPLSTILDACWHRDPSLRPTASDLLSSLEAYAATCHNAADQILFPPLSLSIFQKLHLTLKKSPSLSE